MVDLTVDYTNQIATNLLRLGTQLLPWIWHFEGWSSGLRDKARALKFGLMRMLTGDVDIQPCTHWDETTHSGTWDWGLFDAVIQAIYESGAEPLVCIGGKGYYPPGMSVDPDSGLPVNFETFAEYCVDILEHCKSKGWNIKYWEVLSESGEWGYHVETTELFNLCAERMHTVDPSILIGHNKAWIPPFFHEFLSNAQGMGFLAFNKYDSGRTTAYNPPPDSDALILETAGDLRKNWWSNESGYMYYSPSDMKQMWFQARGEHIPIICAEANLNWAWEGGTDPRVQQIFGAVWYAELVRAYVLDNSLDHLIYWGFASHTRSEDDAYPPDPPWTTGGRGLGMIDCHAPYDEYYSYWLHLMLANRLNVGDPIFEIASSNSTAVSILAWENENCYNILLIGKARSAITVNIEVRNMSVEKDTIISAYTIDDRHSGLQIENMSYSDPISIYLNGYSVILLRTPVKS